MDINKIQDAIIEEFDNLTEYLNRFSYFRHLKKVVSFDGTINNTEKTDENLVTGCSKRVWITAETRDGKIYYRAHSEHSVIRGLLNLLLKVYSGHTAAAITNSDLYFLHEINLFKYLSAERRKDLLSIMQRMKSLAVVHHLKEIR